MWLPVPMEWCDHQNPFPHWYLVTKGWLYIAVEDTMKEGGCPTPGCNGVGHIKGSKYIGHHRWDDSSVMAFLSNFKGTPTLPHSTLYCLLLLYFLFYPRVCGENGVNICDRAAAWEMFTNDGLDMHVLSILQQNVVSSNFLGWGWTFWSQVLWVWRIRNMFSDLQLVVLP